MRQREGQRDEERLATGERLRQQERSGQEIFMEDEGGGVQGEIGGSYSNDRGYWDSWRRIMGLPQC